MFEITGTKSLDSNAVDFVKEGINFVGRTFDDNGIQGKILRRDFDPNEPKTITATVIGHYKYVKYQTEEYYCSQNINKLIPKSIFEKWNKNIAYFLIAHIQKFVSIYDGQQGGYKLSDIKDHCVSLPLKNGEIDFQFMEEFIAELEAERVAELEAYLKASGLDNWILTNEEQNALDDFRNDRIVFKAFTYKKLFNNIKQGRRLKKEDQIAGTIPFVMAGVTNNGVVNYVSNPVATFPKNSITIDIFGNAFYRAYDFGAGDDTGVYWNTVENYSEETMLFFTSAMEKSLIGKFSYGKKLRSSQSFDIKMLLPAKGDTPDFKLINNLIMAIKKIVIKDVVDYTSRKLETTKQVISR